MSTTKHLRVGVIGCGAGIFHLEGYAQDPRVETVALAGLDTDRCDQLATRFGVERRYREYQELLAQDDIDAVSVVVPNNLHLAVVKAALDAGKHVLVEKPLARNAAEGEEMVATAKRTGKLLGIAFQRRHRHDVRIVRELVETGQLGRVYYGKAYWMRRSGIPGWGSWFTAKEAAGGGPLIDLGVHVLDMALFTMGNPKVTAVSSITFAEIGPQGKGNWPGRRTSMPAGAGNHYEVEDLAVALLRLEDGRALELEAAWALYTEMTDEFGIQLYGGKGGAKIHAKDYAEVGTLQLFGDIGDTAVDSTPRLRAAHGHAAIIHNFVSAILDGTPLTPSGEEGLDRVRIIDAIYQSAELGHEVRIES